MTPADQPDGETPLDLALAEYQALFRDGRRPDRRAFLAARPAFAAELEPLLAGLDALNGGGRQIAGDALRPSPPFGPSLRVGEFELLRVIGRGGMGVVYEAVETPLGRRVALKVLPADAAIDPLARRRFLHEARAAALLHHSHVVPVLSVGEAGGVQYYAMPLIDGHSLDAVLRVLGHRAGVEPADEPDAPASKAGLLATGLAVGFDPATVGPIPPAGDPVHAAPRYIDEAVRLVRDAALALAYAHDAGVVHRDVKPGNLILDVRGKLWLTDFGVAKVVGDGAAPTTAGRAGTLRYMSPEQAAGRSADIDARTDVYALGLTLYELLALRPAFAADTEPELLRRIAGTDPKPLRSWNPAVAVDLETVVRKASAKDRADRYPSAAEFAADLDRFRAGVPVLARPLTALQRRWRWARRNRRRLSYAGVAAALGLVLGLGASTYLIWGAYREADARRRQLEVREEELLSLVEQVNHSELVLKLVPGAQAEQGDLVRRVRQVLCRQADQPDASARIRWEAYRACRRVVEVESRQGDREAAKAAARDARDRLADLTRDDPRTRTSRLELARCSRDLGVSFVMARDHDLALEQYRVALGLYEELEAEEPGRTDVLNDLSHVRFAIAGQLAIRGDPAGALAEARRGLDVDEGLRKRFPNGHPQSYIRLTSSHIKFALLHCWAGDPVRAEEQFRQAVESERALVRQFKDPDTLRLYTVQSRGDLGRFLAGRGQFAEARRELNACVTDAERLAGKYPDDVGYRHLLTNCYQELGRLAYLDRNIDDARRWYALMAGRLRTLSPVPTHDSTVKSVGVPVSGPVDPGPLITETEDWLKLDPNHVEFALWRAVARRRCGESAVAEGYLTTLLEFPGHTPVTLALTRYHLAGCQAERGDLAKATATFQSAETTNWQDFIADAAVPVARREAELALVAGKR